MVKSKRPLLCILLTTLSVGVLAVSSHGQNPQSPWEIVKEIERILDRGIKREGYGLSDEDFIKDLQEEVAKLTKMFPPPGSLKFDVFDDFDGAIPDPSKWCRTEGPVAHSIEDGALSFNVASSGEWVSSMLFACEGDKPFQAFETEVMILGGSYGSLVGLTANLTTNEYGTFGLLDTGDIFVRRASPGQPEEGIEKTWPGGGLGIPHRLRIEWTGVETRVIADGELLMAFPSSEPGWWVALSATASDGETTGVFNWAGWNLR